MKKTNKSWLYVLSFALFDSFPVDNSQHPYSYVKSERPCLYCGKLHSHSNSFCCAECCHKWKTKNKKVDR